MKRKIYVYICMDCGFEWESTLKVETFCHMCGCGDLNCEEVNDEENEILSFGESN